MSVIRMRDVRLSRGGTRILDGIDWDVSDGDRWVVLGPNGAGKSTLLELASTYEVPSGGKIDVLDQRIGTVDLRELRRHIGYAGAPLARRLRLDLSARDTVLLGPRAMLTTHLQTFDDDERKTADALLAELDLERVADRSVGRLSEGERQRVQLARVLMTAPELRLLDEPTAGLDIAGREQLVARLGRPDPARATILVTHHLEEIPVGATHVLLLRGGTVLESGPIDATLTSAALSATFGLALEVNCRDGRWTARSTAG